MPLSCEIVTLSEYKLIYALRVSINQGTPAYTVQ